MHKLGVPWPRPSVDVENTLRLLNLKCIAVNTHREKVNGPVMYVFHVHEHAAGYYARDFQTVVCDSRISVKEFDKLVMASARAVIDGRANVSAIANTAPEHVD